MVYEPQKMRFFWRLIRVKKSDVFGQSDLLYRKAPEISLKLGGGGWGSGIFSELHTRAKFLRFFWRHPLFIVEYSFYV